VARNRKRAKERRARRPEPVISARRDRDDGVPTPIAHAAPDVELAEAQLAVGRDPDLEPEPGDDDELAQNGELEDAGALEVGAGGAGGSAISPGARAATGEPGGHAHGAVAEPRAGLLSRLIGFLQGCWRELQRVQWPDRRQVMQATGVVIGFVIIAGIFLGVADTVASQIVKLILK
jgi:preprotein translocase subunit SecE